MLRGLFRAVCEFCCATVAAGVLLLREHENFVFHSLCSFRERLLG